jgi:C-terminal processing protease CtpA/Prc
LALRGYLAAWRKGHLAVRAIAPAASSNSVAPTRVPSITQLSALTALIAIPSFDNRYRLALAALLKQHHATLAARRNWIIDVRGNGGGSDSTYQALLPWLLPNGWVEVSAQWLVTPENIEAHKRACGLFSPGDAECTKFMDEAVRRMQGASAGTFVEQEDGNGWSVQHPETVEPRRPQRVVVIIDNMCGSSREQFVLTVRQSFSVKLMGRSNTMGVIDYSNMRPRDLPSGQRRLLYATSRSNRLPGFPIDGIGISPDIYLPGRAPVDSAADVELARRALEGASWGVR